MSNQVRQVSLPEKQSLSWLAKTSRLSPAARQSLAALAPGLVAEMNGNATRTLAIAGAPGSGKTTLARMLAHVVSESGRAAVTLSLDDYYLPQARRQELARTRHPLLARRGVPGTHDWTRLLHDLDALREGRTDGLRLPVFNKSTDDLEPAESWRTVDVAPSLVIVEGWCLGAPPQPESGLARPVNALENEHDPQAYWRAMVNREVAAWRADLESRVDRFWHVRVPGWDCVLDWRWQQEQELAAPRLKNRTEVGGFLATFQRLVMHMQDTCPDWADLVLTCDRSHRMEIKQ